jgi:HlyD family secretion protein
MSASITLSPTDYKRTASTDLSDWDAVVREESEHQSSFRGPVLLGLATLVFGVGGFFLWAATTHVSQASMAIGRVIVESNTKTVSHLDGGTLKSIAVSEGARVKQGALLATLDVTRSQSIVIQLTNQLYMLDIRMARLIAEKDEEKNFVYDKPAPSSMDQALAGQLVSTETKLFQERRSQFADMLAVDQSTVEQLDSQKAALVARRKSSFEQAQFLRNDYDSVAHLEKQQLATTALLNEKKIMLVDMETRVAESDAAIAENKQRRNQAELSLSNRRTDYFRAISELIQQAQSDSSRLGQDLVGARDIVAKSEIRAPQDGIVANIRIRTPGSAVIGGNPILDIVPNNQPMLIEGRVKAADIDSVHVGEKADVKLASFGTEEAMPLISHIIYIAPDSILDERTGDTTYLFRAQINDGELKKQPNLFLYPGMTADVSIINGNRTALTYLAQPIMRSFHRSFREQ